MPRELIPKDYMGDGIYIEDIGHTVSLTTENGISVQNKIHIGFAEFAAIKRYFKRVEEGAKNAI